MSRPAPRRGIDWSDITQPGTAGQVEGKRAYAFTISKDNDGSVIDLSNEDYNADIGTADSGGTLLRTPEGNTVTVTLHDQPQETQRSTVIPLTAPGWRTMRIRTLARRSAASLPMTA